MTKRRVMRYTSLKREIAMLEEQLRTAGGGDDDVVDYAKEYLTGYPRIITLRGRGSQDVPRLSKRITACIAECKDIEDFIADLDDCVMRQLLTRRYLEGRTLRETAELVGYSESQTKRLINNFFEKMTQNEP